MSLFSRAALTTSLRLGLFFKTPRCSITTERIFNDVDKVLKVDSYEERRKIALEKVKSSKNDFVLRIANGLESGTSSLDSRDVKELIHIADKQELELVVAALKKLELQSSRLRFSSFNSDAVVMRMFHYLNAPEEACSAFLDTHLKNIFVGFNSVLILLDLLYQSNKFQSILDCIECLEKRQNWNVWSGKSTTYYYMISCLKLNTPESAKKGVIHFEKIVDFRRPSTGSALIAAYLASRSDPCKVGFCLGFVRDYQKAQVLKHNITLQLLATQKKQDEVLASLEMNNKFFLFQDTIKIIFSLLREKKSSQFVETLQKSVGLINLTVPEGLINYVVFEAQREGGIKERDKEQEGKPLAVRKI